MSHPSHLFCCGQEAPEWICEESDDEHWLQEVFRARTEREKARHRNMQKIWEKKKEEEERERQEAKDDPEWFYLKMAARREKEEDDKAKIIQNEKTVQAEPFFHSSRNQWRYIAPHPFRTSRRHDGRRYAKFIENHIDSYCTIVQSAVLRCCTDRTTGMAYQDGTESDQVFEPITSVEPLFIPFHFYEPETHHRPL